MDSELLRKAKSFGFSDRQIAHLTGTSEDAVRAERKKLGLVPSYRLVDTCAAEFEAYTPYYYSTYDCGDEAGLDATIIMHPIIWEASGHLKTFSDPMVDCLLTNKRYRADQIDPQSGIAYFYSGAKDAKSGKQSGDSYSVLVPKGKPPESARKTATQFYQQRGIAEPELQGERSEEVTNSQRYNPENGSQLTEARPFNLMFKSHYGPIQSDENACYLRPETAQAIFVQFKNVLESSRQKVPFGIAQIGKAFRNEITPRNFIFRSREFEQMELEFFIPPDEAVAALYGSVATPSGEGHPGEPQANWGW